MLIYKYLRNAVLRFVSFAETECIVLINHRPHICMYLMHTGNFMLDVLGNQHENDWLCLNKFIVQ